VWDLAWKLQHLEVGALQKAIVSGAYSMVAMEIAARLKDDDRREEIVRAIKEKLGDIIYSHTPLTGLVASKVMEYWQTWMW
jgi:hypothetical protein